MDVLVVRHAAALERGEAEAMGMPDSERPLTAEGRARMKRIARGLGRRVPDLGLLLSSPWRRAWQTAELLGARYPGIACVESEALLPEAEPGALAQVLLAHAHQPLVAVVGHEPMLSGWVSWCLVGETRPLLALRKGGACLLRFAAGVEPGQGRLHWLLTPALARRL